MGWNDKQLFTKVKGVGLIINLPPNDLVGELGHDVEVGPGVELNESTMPWAGLIGCRNRFGFNILQGILVYLENADEIRAKIGRCNEVAGRVQDDLMRM